MSCSLILDGICGVIERSLQSEERRGSRAAWKLASGAIGLVLLVGVMSSTSRSDVIRVATKPMTEQYIMGEMLRVLIEQGTELEVELTTGGSMQ